jgi:hypothetical protein
MQGESAATAGYHSTYAAITHNENQMAEETIGALSNIATATTPDRGVVEFSDRPMHVLPSSWRTTQTSCGNSRLYSRRNAGKIVANAASIPHPQINVGLMATKLVVLTRVSLVNS